MAERYGVSTERDVGEWSEVKKKGQWKKLKSRKRTK